MKHITKEMIKLSDLQKEIFDIMILKYPQCCTDGNFSDLINRIGLVMPRPGMINKTKDISFEKAINNLSSNLNRFSKLNIFKNEEQYNDLVKRLNSIKEEVESLEALNLRLSIKEKTLLSMNEESLEYKIGKLKHYYDTIMYLSDVELRHKTFDNYYNMLNLNEVMSIKEACEKYEFRIDALRTFLNRGANGLIENVDYKKTGGTWIITENGIEKYQKVRKEHKEI